METIIFIGIQASGKSTFYKENFFQTHLRISLDMLKTRNKEGRLIETCFATRQKFVVDNTNTTTDERKKYIEQAKINKYKVIGYYFQSNIAECIKRNNNRFGKSKIPEIGIKGTYSKLELPNMNEGFDELFYVSISSDGFVIKEWKDEV
jgi:predicted kinase